jgi:hypothetical protein
MIEFAGDRMKEMNNVPEVTAAVEGIVDEAVVRRLLEHVGAKLGRVYGKNGKQSLLKQMRGYNQAARHGPWVVIVDLDDDADCAPPFRAKWLTSINQRMCFRIAVREVETWLMADREHLAEFLHIAVSKVPLSPEEIRNPKQTMVNLARNSRLRAIQKDMVPRPASGRQIGPAYPSRLIEFVESRQRGWRPDVAANTSDSLRRCLRCLKKLVEGHGRPDLGKG